MVCVERQKEMSLVSVFHWPGSYRNPDGPKHLPVHFWKAHLRVRSGHFQCCWWTICGGVLTPIILELVLHTLHIWG
jgi:hypothetical protein